MGLGGSRGYWVWLLRGGKGVRLVPSSQGQRCPHSCPGPREWRAPLTGLKVSSVDRDPLSTEVGFCQSAVSLPQPPCSRTTPNRAGRPLSLCGRLLEFVILPNPASDPCGQEESHMQQTRASQQILVPGTGQGWTSAVPSPLLRALEVQVQDLCSGMKRKDGDACLACLSGPPLSLCEVTHRPRQTAWSGSRAKVSQSWGPQNLRRELQGTFKGALGLLFTLNRPCLKKHYMSWDVLSEDGLAPERGQAGGQPAVRAKRTGPRACILPGQCPVRRKEGLGPPAPCAPSAVAAGQCLGLSRDTK